MNDDTHGESPAARETGFDHEPLPGFREAEAGECRGGLNGDLADLNALETGEFLERLCEDHVMRWHAGQRVPAEAYLARHPRLQGEGEATFELIYGEFLLREQVGDAPSPEEFYWRFPQFAARLARQLELHGVLNSESSTLDDRAGPAPEIDPLESSAVTAIRSIAPGYTVLGELGRGGMGAVYKAWQVSLKRVVALKVIRADAYADSGAAARFHAEAEAAARIQHPNIVQVFEVGENEGLGYLVLEYVAGEGLDRKLTGALQDPRESARLIEILARAIHFAHQRGIVHRDLKPANVLMTEDGIPKITDFGLAKLLERDEGLTQVGDLLGTPSYMAPEQVHGRSDQVTPATDVYALGAILYEMLTGRPPFKGTTPLSTLEQVSTQEPLNPGRIQRHTPRDLETICLKCLHKDPRRRYWAAWDLADDLRRFLESKPVLARPTPVWERGWKCARRRPAAAAVLACSILAALLVAGLGVHYNARLRGALRTAQAAEQAAASSALAAVEQRNLALKAFKQLVYDVQEKLGQTPATRSLRRAMLNTAIAGIEEIARSTAGSASDLSQAVAHQKLGDIFRIIGRSAEARLHFENSRELSEDLLASVPGDLSAGENLYQSHMGLGLLDITAKQFDDAKIEFRRAVTIAETIAADPTYQEGREALVEAYLQLGRSYSFARDFSAAEVWFRKMQVLASRWVSERPKQTLARDLLAASYRKLGDLKKFAKDYQGARKDYLTAITLGRQILADEPGSLAFKAHLAIALDDLAGVARDQGETAEARQFYREAGELGTDLVQADPEDSETYFRFLHTQYKLARLEESESQFPRAADLLRVILDHVKRLDRYSRLEGRTDSFANVRALTSEIAFCEAAPRARSEFDFARSQQRPDVAARLLVLHARTIADSKADARRLDAVGEALLALKADHPEDEIDIARHLAVFVADLDSRHQAGPTVPQRKSLRDRCADRGVELVREAVERGFRSNALLEGAELRPLLKHAGYQSFERVQKPSSSTPAPRVKMSE